jgi:hypothetical protein
VKHFLYGQDGTARSSRFFKTGKNKRKLLCPD